ncbi:L-seryl-tRNA(Sec) selenium transferase [Candidatus Uabimicrobium amorphum]|nr:L-seryl-tRNA(Sec) selenium transferase [Candidatus Uabimicrobium amorphum]
MDKYKQIPSVSRLLEDTNIRTIQVSREIKVQVIRDYLQKLRRNIETHNVVYEDIAQEICHIIASQVKSLRRCINATGIILHTGLGRAPISQDILDKLHSDLRGYINLEIDCTSGTRSHRDDHLRTILKSLTGAEDASIVNNNAAAVLIAISTVAKNKEVIVSSGQLVEIGGSFRIPEVIEQSGAKLRIVGCTNKTYIRDYENAINENTAAILHVHTSNYKIVGFCHEPGLDELSKLAKKHNIALIEDAGSGLLNDFSVPILKSELTVKNSIRCGVDLITFSGDKLLGGCQAGIIVGKQKFIQGIRKNPLLRALRVDKFTTFILQQALYNYQTNVHKTNPVFEMLTRTAQETQQISEQIANALHGQSQWEINVEQFPGYAGSGALPAMEIESFAVAIRSPQLSLTSLAQKLRLNDPALFTVLKNNTLYVAPRSLLKGEHSEVIDILKKYICL